MKILIYSGTFFPNIGGMETVASVLAHQFLKLGHKVRVVSITPESAANDRQGFPFEIIRVPSHKKLLSLVKWSDIFFNNGLSLKALWPVFLFRKKIVVVHQTWYRRSRANDKGWQDYLKLFMCRYIVNVSISKAIAAHIPAKSHLIVNPYQTNIFFLNKEVPRNKELIFVGRLVSDKGVDLLLEAMVELKHMGIKPKLTIVGDGPEKSNLQNQVASAHLENQVVFLGVKKGKELVHVLNEHKILVVPSRWAEPFGIVALEGVSCGCVVVGSGQGGLKEAIGPCGVTFPNNDVQKLTAAIYELLTNTQLMNQYLEKAEDHLKKFNEEYVAERYLEIFAKIASNNSTR